MEAGLGGQGETVLGCACVKGLRARVCLHACAQLYCTHAILWVREGRNQCLLFSGLVCTGLKVCNGSMRWEGSVSSTTGQVGWGVI